MRILLTCLFVGIICFKTEAQTKKYKAIITALHTDYIGYVYVDLAGENKEMIRIDGKSIEDSSSLSKLLSIPDKEFATFKINASLVSRIIIAEDTFYRQDMLDTYENTDRSNRKQNCFVKKIYGKEDIQLYEWKDKNGKVKYYFKLPQEDVLQNIDHPYFDEWNMSVYYGFKKCKKISKRFLADYQDKTKYPFYQLKTEEKLIAWKKLIDEYNSCELVTSK